MEREHDSITDLRAQWWGVQGWPPWHDVPWMNVLLQCQPWAGRIVLLHYWMWCPVIRSQWVQLESLNPLLLCNNTTLPNPFSCLYCRQDEQTSQTVILPHFGWLHEVMHGCHPPSLSSCFIIGKMRRLLDGAFCFFLLSLITPYYQNNMLDPTQYRACFNWFDYHLILAHGFL